MAVYLKKEVWNILEKENINNALISLNKFPPTKVVSPLIGAFLHVKEEVRWKAIIAFGYMVSRIAEKELEKARVVIRRLIWILNEESGGMAWGVPEGFAEALYNHEILKNEYLSIFVSYIWNTEDTQKYKADNYLEFPPAQRGVIWGLGRLAQKYKNELLTKKAHFHLYKHLISSPDLAVKFLSLWSLNNLFPFPEDFKINLRKVQKTIELLEKENFSYLMFDGKEITQKHISHLKKLLKLF
ncbi:MAG: hypothetical protein J7K20_04660 [Thermodesulfobacterium sp.]|nr:hypothetical protein [Thermodesulfobacterium sp.]